MYRQLYVFAAESMHDNEETTSVSCTLFLFLCANIYRRSSTVIY